MGDATATYIDDDGQKWYVCAFWQPKVLSRRAETPESDVEQATIVFERPGEERVATTTSLHDWNTEIRLRELFLGAVDRRQGGDRRTSHNRRTEEVQRHPDLRSGTDRRTGVGRRRADRVKEGRVGENKLRDTPVTYTREEAGQIRAMAMLGARPICPICGEDLDVGSRVARGDDTIRQLSCPNCFRAVMVRGMG